MPSPAFTLSHSIKYTSDFTPDPVSGIGIIDTNKIACAPRQLNLVEKIGMVTKI